MRKKAKKANKTFISIWSKLLSQIVEGITKPTDRTKLTAWNTQCINLDRLVQFIGARLVFFADFFFCTVCGTYRPLAIHRFIYNL